MRFSSSSQDHFQCHILELYPWDVVLGCCLLYEPEMHCMFPGTIGVQQRPCSHQNTSALWFFPSRKFPQTIRHFQSYTCLISPFWKSRLSRKTSQGCLSTRDTVSNKTQTKYLNIGLIDFFNHFAQMSEISHHSLCTKPIMYGSIGMNNQPSLFKWPVPPQAVEVVTQWLEGWKERQKGNQKGKS